MLPLETHAHISGLSKPAVLKVVRSDHLPEFGLALGDCAVLQEDESAPPMRGAGAVIYKRVPDTQVANPTIVLRDPLTVGDGDVIRVHPGTSLVKVLYRRGANGNVLFVTERCNSKCLMCSQPPRDADDSWKVDELFKLVPLIDPNERSLAITGGEPTLLGTRLVDLIEFCGEVLPQTALHVLSNGRALKDPKLVRRLAAVGHPALTWGIPLYSDSPETHDHVVQALGAFEETVHGLYNLAEYRQHVEIRVVLHKLTIPRLRELAYFIFHNLAFVDHVAMMGIEPIGFAPGNHDVLWQDPADYQLELAEAMHFLANRGIAVSIYNLPLCIVDPSLLNYYKKSISDWKNVYLEECGRCEAKHRCGGFFASTRERWVSLKLRPFTSEVLGGVSEPVGGAA